MPTTPTNVIDYRIIRSIDTTREAYTSVALAANTYYPLGCALQPSGVAGQLTVTPSGGTGTPVAIAPQAMTTDANGNITFGTPATGTQFGYTETTVGVLIAGTFNVTDLYTQASAPGAWVNNNFTPGNAQQFGTLVGSLTAGVVVK